MTRGLESLPPEAREVLADVQQGQTISVSPFSPLLQPVRDSVQVFAGEELNAQIKVIINAITAVLTQLAALREQWDGTESESGVTAVGLELLAITDEAAASTTGESQSVLRTVSRSARALCLELAAFRTVGVTTKESVISFLAAERLVFQLTNIKTSAYTMVLNEFVRVDPSAGGFTLTLPVVAPGNSGYMIGVKNMTTSANTITIVGAGSDTVDGGASITIAASRGIRWLMSDGVSEWMTLI